MAIQKNFIIKNGLEVDSNLLVADSVTNSVGIGTSNPNYTFEVIGGIGVTNINALGISTVLTEFNVGTGGTVFTSLNTGLTGFGTAMPEYIVDIRSPVSTGQTALYVQGDVRVTGDLVADDITLDQATFSNIEVTGVGTIANFKSTSAIVSGLTTTGSLAVGTGFDVYAADSTFRGNVTIDGNLSIGGTSAILNAVQVRVEDKDIVLGFTTAITPSDDTANHGGIAIASTEGYPLISMSASGINTLPDTYKQIMWLKRNTMGAGTTDAFLFNYAVGVGSTQVPNGVRFAAGSIQFTDNVINTTNLNATGVSTIRTSSIDLGYVKTGITTNLITTGIASIATGIITTLNGDNLNYSGIGSFGSVNATTGRINTGIVTNLSVSGISTFSNVVEFDSGLKDIYNQVGVAGSILVSTGVGVSWTPPFAAGIQGIQGTQGTQGIQGVQGTQGIQGIQGVQGITGTGTQGTQGITGTGTQGIQGIQGISGGGGSGTQGTQGATGAQGNNGSNGTQGATGAQGAIGAQGTNGSNGTQGATGATGVQGTTGTQGTSGGGGSITDDTSTNSTLYPLFQSATSGTLSGVSVSSTNLQFNPATGTLSATIFTSLSDKTQKTNIRPIDNSIDLVKQLEGVRYDWINNQKPSIGVIAQDIEKVLPEVVEMNSNGLKSVSYGNIVGVLIEAIKEQQVRIEELERKLNA